MDASKTNALDRLLSRQSRAGALAISTRAALRVFPFWFREDSRGSERKTDLTALPILQVLLSLAVSARGHPTRKFTNIVNRVGNEDLARILRDAASGADDADVEEAAAFAADAASRAANVADLFDETYIAELFDESSERDEASASVWAAIDYDALQLLKKADPLEMPLWHNVRPKWFTKADTESRAIWAADPPGRWDFWLRWWDGILAGTPVDWDLQRDVALIPDANWQQGPDHIARLIAGIERDHAIAATPNGETIEINPESGCLRIVPVTDLPADIGIYARRKIRKALDLFGETPGNQYAALRDDLRLLRDATDDPDSTPVELFDACASASRRLTQRIRNAECPTGEQDPVIADYATRIREAGADILGNDPKTQEMLSARNAITGNNALIEGGAVIRAASDLIVGGTEGLLAKALPRDAAVATDPNADPEDRKVAGFRTASRLLRIGKVIATPVAWVGGTTIGVAAVIQAVPVILRFLGF